MKKIEKVLDLEKYKIIHLNEKIIISAVKKRKKYFSKNKELALIL